MKLGQEMIALMILVGFHQVLAFVHPLFMRSESSSKLANLAAKCDKSGLMITLHFDKPFNGVVYSIGHHGSQECTYIAPNNGGQTTYTFLIPVDKCGTEGQYREPKPGERVSIKNTIVIQHDAAFITAEDSAHALSCTWADSYYKPVSTKPIQVQQDQQPQLVTQEQRLVPVVLNPIGTEPGALKDRRHNIASGLFQAEKEKNVIISVMDPFDQYDASVMDCMAFDYAGNSAIALTDKDGCMLQVSLMPPFKKIRSTGVGLTLYSTIMDAKLASNKDLVIKCNIQICQKQCQTPCMATTENAPSKDASFHAFPVRI